MSDAIFAGRGGQPFVRATHAASGATLEVALHGATITSYVHKGAVHLTRANAAGLP